MYDFFRVSAAVTKISVADVNENEKSIIRLLKKSAAMRPDAVVFPELCTTGYTCGDLFFQKALTDAAAASVNNLARISEKYDFPLIIGTPLVINGSVYNCAAVIFHGRIAGVVPKTFIPGYNEFYEKRWFASAVDLKCTSIPSSDIGANEDYDIPIGNNLIFKCGDVKFGVEICEDLWSTIPPSDFLSLGGAQVIFNLSASNETTAKRNYRRELVSQQSARTLGSYVYVSAGPGESTTDLVFSGHCIFAENGTVVCESADELADSEFVMTTDMDVGKSVSDRKKITTFRDTKSVYGSLVNIRCIDLQSDSCRGDGTLANVSRMPFVPSDKNDRHQRCRSIFEMQVAGLKKRLEVTGARPVIGVSGGLDSTLALLVAQKAMLELGRDAAEVCGITMPCFGTSDRTYRNAVALMEKLKITQKEINIKNACNLHFEDIGHNPDVHDLTYENSQARERTQVLMDYAGKIGGLVVGTGDLSELALGWCTYNADHMSMYGVNASIPKTLVKWMIEVIADADLFENCADILRDIADTPISPELIPPEESGNISQKTEDIVGPYELHDFFLYYILRYGFEPKKIFALAKKAYLGIYDEDTILKWLKNFYKRFFTQQFKRSCLPDGVKVGSVCLSPRGDWRMPSDASGALWLSQLESL